MATPIMMPKVGISVESCILTEWHKKKGDHVNIGDLLFTYETDKSVIEEQSEAEGILLEQFVSEGDDVPVMTNVCVIGEEGESTAEFAPQEKESASAPKEAVPDATEKADTPACAAPPAADGFVKASPRAKNLAKRTGADIRCAVPTGPENRVIERDVQELLAHGPAATYAAGTAFGGAPGTGIGGRFSVSDISAAPEVSVPAVPKKEAEAPEYQDEKLNGIRRAIAKSMSASLSAIPQLTHTLTFDASEIIDLRKKLKNSADFLGLGNITLNDIVLFAVSRVLAKPEHHALNAHFIGSDTVRSFGSVHLGVAVDTPRGLMVPTLCDAQKKSLNEIASETKELAAACQKGDINPDLLTGATFTVSNVGSFGVESFTPVINPPQTGILGVNTITTRVREVDGKLCAYPAMGLSLTYDHRAVDGAPASRFLKELKTVLENFSVALCL